MQPLKERPILFSGPMVRAVLDGSKTQTRRVVKRSGDMEFDKNDPHYGPYWLAYAAGDAMGEDAKVRCPYGTPGDRLWVRETFAQDVAGCPGGISYRADHFDPKGDGPAHPMKWRPSIFMPRMASRILLEITDVRVQRLQEISEGDARAEGVSDGGCFSCGNPEPCGCGNPQPDARDGFAWLWQSIHGTGSWDANPWVWAITFQRLEP
jgi:hypothetical protein